MYIAIKSNPEITVIKKGDFLEIICFCF